MPPQSQSVCERSLSQSRTELAPAKLLTARPSRNTFPAATGRDHRSCDLRALWKASNFRNTRRIYKRRMENRPVNVAEAA